MNYQALRDAVTLAGRLQHVLIGTANRKKEPHIAAAAVLRQVDETHVTASAWFCPTTVANLHENPAVCLVIWDRESDRGFQLTGQSEKIEDMAMLDGYAPAFTEKITVPQVERSVLIRVDRVIDFKHAPHNDIED